MDGKIICLERADWYSTVHSVVKEPLWFIKYITHPHNLKEAD